MGSWAALGDLRRPDMRSWDCGQGVGTSGGESGCQGSLVPLEPYGNHTERNFI